MGAKANLFSIDELKNVNSGIHDFRRKALDDLYIAEQEIVRTMDWLQERKNYWSHEITRRTAMVNQASAALSRCMSSGFTDKNGVYHPPNCGAYVLALEKARRYHAESVEESKKVAYWINKVQQNVDSYKRENRKLTAILTDTFIKASTYLGKCRSLLETYIAIAPAVLSSIDSGSGAGAEISNAPADTGSNNSISVTWAEQQKILEKANNGERITNEEFKKLTIWPSDIRAETLVPDDSWIRNIMTAEQYYELTREAWLGEAPAQDASAEVIAWTLAGILADISKFKQHWKNRG